MSEEPEIVLGTGPPPLPAPEPWSGWMTLVWLFVTMGTWFAAQIGVTIVWGALDGAFSNPQSAGRRLEALAMDGDFLGVATVTAALVACPMCYLIGRWRRGFSGMGYLALRLKPRLWPTIGWSVVTVLLGIVFGLVAPSLGVEETPEFMRDAVRSSDFIVFLILGVVLGAPLVEEFIFRGVLFRGWRESRLGLWGTLIVTSLLWTLLHIQYGPVILIYIFLLGLLLGHVRERSGNLWIPIIMHAVNNAIATFEAIRLAG